ncbi:MAG: hypothetical protein ABIQ52_18505 [Vicinamibacterales bacterium]
MRPWILIPLLLAATPAAAQQTPSEVLSFLVTNQSVQTNDFQRDRSAAAATRDTITRALLVSLATVPIATSSSGFVYRLDPELGTVRRVSDSFGTFFVERAMTSGRGRASFGVAGTTAGYDRLDGLRLGDGSLVTTANQFRDEAAPFDTESLTLRIRTSTFTVFGAYAVTDRLEIGGAVPLVRLHLEGSRVNVYRGQAFVQATGRADASGLADVAVRAKYRLASSSTGGFAVAGEVRLPTGKEADLLGTGRTGLRLAAVGSVENVRVGLHGNAGFTRGGVSDEINGSGAVTVAATPHLTLSGELLVRRLSDLREVAAASAPHPSFSGVNTMRLVPGVSTPILSSAIAGVKWNPRATMVISGQVLWRLGKGGLTAPFTPTLSIDYLF